MNKIELGQASVLKTHNARFWKTFLGVTSVIFKGYGENICFSEVAF